MVKVNRQSPPIMSDPILIALKQIHEELIEIRSLLAAGRIQTAVSHPENPVQQLRPVYSVEEFRTEVLGGHRTAEWVRDQCRSKRIKTVTRRPYLIPQSEAVRMAGAMTGR